jgi:hypothetical protein
MGAKSKQASLLLALVRFVSSDFAKTTRMVKEQLIVLLNSMPYSKLSDRLDFQLVEADSVYSHNYPNF